MSKELVTEAKLDVILGILTKIQEHLFKDTVAAKSEIDGPYGDPKIGFSPKIWKGKDYKGATASLCPVDFLEVYAEALEWSAANPQPGKDPKFVEYNKRDARKVRRWITEKTVNPALNADKFTAPVSSPFVKPNFDDVF